MSTAIAEPPSPAQTPAAKPSVKPPGEEAASFLESLHGGKQKPKEADKTDEAKVKTDQKAAGKALAAKPAVVAPAAKQKISAPNPPPHAEPDYEKIAEAAGRGVAAAIKKAEPEKKPETDPLDELADDERELHETYAQMEKDYPQYKGLGKKYLDSLKAADEWEAQWLEAHPGEELSEDNPDYEQFIKKNSIHYNDLHLHKSLAKLEVEKLSSKERENDSAEVETLKQRERIRDAVPAIIAQRVDSAREYFGALGDDFKDVLDANGNINGDAIKKLVESDPLKDIALKSAEAVEGFADELYRLSNALTQFNEKSGAHAFIASFVADNESYLESLPLADQEAFVAGLPDKLKVGKVGRRYATADQYAKLPENQRGRYFRLRHDDVAYLYAVDQAKRAKEMIAAEEKRVEELAAKRGWKKVDATATAANQPAPSAPKPLPPAPLAPSPSGSIEPRPALPSKAVNGADKNPADSFARMWIG